jgi:hypothetical protein
MKSTPYVVLIALAFTQYSWVIAGAPTSKPAAGVKFILLTELEHGFREAETRYLVGMPVDAFRRKFGEPDRELEDALNYNRDGIRVICEKGKIKRFVFFFQREDMSELGAGVFEPASAKTEKGITSTASIREFVRVHGDPQKRVQTRSSVYLTYPFGVAEFSGSQLNSISIGESD